MRTVYKYPIDITKQQTISIRKEQHTALQILRFGLDPTGCLCLWIELVPGDFVYKCELWLVPTGGTVPSGKKYVGTAIDDTAVVWHLYV